MKRCKFCGRSNSRLIEVRTPLLNFADGWKCKSPIACIKRMQRIGEWEGKRVLRRFDADGTEWTIRRHDDVGLRGMAAGPWTLGYVLICEHREQRVISRHPDVDAAKAHADEFLASFTARRIDEYRDEPQPDDDQLELA